MRPKPYTAPDAVFTAKLGAWQPYSRGFISAFGPNGFARLNALDRRFDPGRRKIVALTFENRFAPLGGLAAVMRLLPGSLRKAAEDVIILTPLYVNIPSVKEAVDDGPLTLAVPPRKFSSPPYKGEFSCYIDGDAPVTAYYIGIEGRFTASPNPYAYDNPDDLLDDSLAFCAAVPFVLRELGFCRDILFHAHDWETAPVALTSKIAMLDGVLESARTVLTLHNSFDCGIGAARKKLYFGVEGDGRRGDRKGKGADAKGAAGKGIDPKGAGDGGWVKNVADTVLQMSIPLLNGPLTTVSTPFAAELRDDPLQRTVFTTHLQDVFAVNPPVGIENGMFGKPYLRYTYAALSWARQGNYSKLLAQKGRFRDKMLEVVAEMQGRDGVIGGLSEVLGAGHPPAAPGRPVFFMSGRLDLSQKGFDVIFHAVRKFQPGRAGLIFCPSSADRVKHAKELAFFKKVADEMPGDIVVWPFRISGDEYTSVVLGSSFLLMPSFYEPFGAATEGLMLGTPVVARATGGLQVQVRPYGACPPYDTGATGILYREEGDEGWKEILESPVAGRVKVPLYQSMVDAALGALSAAEAVFADPDLYGRMVVNGMDSLRSFSWDAAVCKYRRVYDAASRRGFFDD
ncbi:MAG: glycogen/starch synthase [Chitinispirillia bacterium]|nr:glycogen/starch synthase [Chitinispirillia bacterium]MCL2241895.1 glycogen/starch synthase [Chitinispirillia bacterium]